MNEVPEKLHLGKVKSTGKGREDEHISVLIDLKKIKEKKKEGDLRTLQGMGGQPFSRKHVFGREN